MILGPETLLIYLTYLAFQDAFVIFWSLQLRQCLLGVHTFSRSRTRLSGAFNTYPKNMIDQHPFTPVVWLLIISHTHLRFPYYCTAYRLTRI